MNASITIYSVSSQCYGEVDFINTSTKVLRRIQTGIIAKMTIYNKLHFKAKKKTK